MNDADAALSRDSDGQARFGDGVHGRGSKRNGEPEFARELRARGDFVGYDRRFSGDEKNVIESKAFLNGTVYHSNPLASGVEKVAP